MSEDENNTRCHRIRREGRQRQMVIGGVAIFAISFYSAGINSDALVVPTSFRQATKAVPSSSTIGRTALWAASNSGPMMTTTASPMMPTCDAEEEVSSPEDFELHVGRAMDTLRKDYPAILTDQPDFSIYDRHLEVVDPSGVKVHGLKAYKNAFRLLHAVVKVFYCPDRSDLTFRYCYDGARRNIRVHWNAHVVPREMFGGSRSTLHVDGISVYELDRSTGNITQHRIEHLLMNDAPVLPEEGVIAALQDHHAVTIPNFINTEPREDMIGMVQFQPQGAFSFSGGNPSPLFAMEASSPSSGGGAEDADQQQQQYSGIDMAALDKKNKSRKKFGLQPLTPEEFIELQDQVRQMESQQQHRRAAAAAAEMAKDEADAAERGKGNGFLDRLFGDALKDTCESNFDCERPQVCCDFGFKKVCCSSGSFVYNGPAKLEPRLVPVPVDVGYPPDQDPRGAAY